MLKMPNKSFFALSVKEIMYKGRDLIKQVAAKIFKRLGLF